MPDSVHILEFGDVDYYVFEEITSKPLKDILPEIKEELKQ